MKSRSDSKICALHPYKCLVCAFLKKFNSIIELQIADFSLFWEKVAQPYGDSELYLWTTLWLRKAGKQAADTAGWNIGSAVGTFRASVSLLELR